MKLSYQNNHPIAYYYCVIVWLYNTNNGDLFHPPLIGLKVCKLDILYILPSIDTNTQKKIPWDTISFRGVIDSDDWMRGHTNSVMFTTHLIIRVSGLDDVINAVLNVHCPSIDVTSKPYGTFEVKFCWDFIALWLEKQPVWDFLTNYNKQMVFVLLNEESSDFLHCFSPTILEEF